MNPRICPVCGTPQHWDLWSHCPCGYDFGPPPAPQPNPTTSDSGNEFDSSQDPKRKRFSYGALFRRVLLAFVAIYGALGFVYGTLVAVRGLPPGEIKLPLGAGSIGPASWTSVGGKSDEENKVRAEPDPFAMRTVVGLTCTFMIAFQGLWMGLWVGTLAVLFCGFGVRFRLTE